MVPLGAAQKEGQRMVLNPGVFPALNPRLTPKSLRLMAENSKKMLLNL